METNRLPATIPINGAEVRRLRIYQRYLGVEPFAQEAQISRQYLQDIESGRRNRVSPAVFGRLRAALQVEDQSVLLAHQPELAASHK